MSQLTNHDLEERTSEFSKSIISICKSTKPNLINTPIITQPLRSATSIGANYAEVNNASSKKDLANKIFICKKEAQETKYWLRMLSKATNVEGTPEKLRPFWKECHELTMIFQKIANSLRSK